MTALDDACVPARAARIADALRARIADGTWPVGSRIPTEPQLSAMLGVGRNSVREGVQALVHAGLLRKRQGSGTFVISDDELGLALSRTVGRSAQADALEVGHALEVAAVQLAAVHRSDRDVSMLRVLEAARRSGAQRSELGSAASSDLALHHAIVVASRNTLLLSLYESLLDAIGSPSAARHPLCGIADPDDHGLLVDAIDSGDPVAAVNALGIARPDTATFL